MSTILATSKVSKSFGGVIAADSISIDIPAGQVVSLIGSNGAGKTTFVNMVTGYVKPDSGSILLGGRNITALGPREITRLGVSRSFQIPQIFLRLTTLQNVVLAIDIHEGGFGRHFRQAVTPAKAERAMDVLSSYRLGRYADQLASSLPGGVRKLLDIALAVVCDPQVLFLDEPTSGTANQEKFAIMDLIMSALARQKVSVMFIEHDMEIVRRYARTVIAFHEGGLLMNGATNDVLNSEIVRKHVIGKVGTVQS